MTLNVVETHLQFETAHTFASIQADAGLSGIGGFSNMVFGSMSRKRGVAKKVTSTGIAAF